MWPPVSFAAIPLKGVAVNLSFEVNEKLHRKVSPPFEGGEMYQAYIHVLYLIYVLNSLDILLYQTLRLTAMP